MGQVMAGDASITRRWFDFPVGSDLGRHAPTPPTHRGRRVIGFAIDGLPIVSETSEERRDVVARLIQAERAAGRDGGALVLRPTLEPRLGDGGAIDHYLLTSTRNAFDAIAPAAAVAEPAPPESGRRVFAAFHDVGSLVATIDDAGLVRLAAMADFVGVERHRDESLIDFTDRVRALLGGDLDLTRYDADADAPLVEDFHATGM